MPRRQSSIQKARAESLFKRQVEQQVEGVKALNDYRAKEQATRLLTAKLRAERLSRESKPRTYRDLRHIPVTAPQP